VTAQLLLVDLGPSSAPVSGWARVDPRPWTKTAAVWRHVSGWTLHHCGHPTAIYQWDLRAPNGRRVSRGWLFSPPDEHDPRAWRTLAEAQAFVDDVLAGRRPVPAPAMPLEGRAPCPTT